MYSWQGGASRMVLVPAGRTPAPAPQSLAAPKGKPMRPKRKRARLTDENLCALQDPLSLLVTEQCLVPILASVLSLILLDRIEPDAILVRRRFQELYPCGYRKIAAWKTTDGARTWAADNGVSDEAMRNSCPHRLFLLWLRAACESRWGRAKGLRVLPPPPAGGAQKPHEAEGAGAAQPGLRIKKGPRDKFVVRRAGVEDVFVKPGGNDVDFPPGTAERAIASTAWERRFTSDYELARAWQRQGVAGLGERPLGEVRQLVNRLTREKRLGHDGEGGEAR